MNANASLDSIDHTIDRALAALRDAQPRSGSEMFAGRVLASLEHRTVTPRPAHVSARLALWAATSAAILAVASLAILHHQAAPNSMTSAQLRAPQVSPLRPGIESPRTSAEPTPRVIHPLANAKEWAQDAGAAIVVTTSHTLSSRPEHRSIAAMRSGETCISDRHDPGCPIHEEGAAVVVGGVATTLTDAQLLADLHAPNHPAPPLPPTPQERDYLRMLRYGNTTQLAELRPIPRVKKDAGDNTDFDAFFPGFLPDPPPVPEPGDNE